MDNVTNEILYETLKAIRGDIAEMKADNRAHRELTSGLMKSDNVRYDQIANLQTRLDRIERRLELSD